jgi:very-short-patch-repair endonuclease
VGVLDMGWEDYMVALEYDGDQHRTDRRQFVKDINRLDTIQDLGWTVIRVVAEHRPQDIVARVQQALIRRGYLRDRR